LVRLVRLVQEFVFVVIEEEERTMSTTAGADSYVFADVKRNVAG